MLFLLLLFWFFCCISVQLLNFKNGNESVDDEIQIGKYCSCPNCIEFVDVVVVVVVVDFIVVVKLNF